jgi:hypothetical protein
MFVEKHSQHSKSNFRSAKFREKIPTSNVCRTPARILIAVSVLVVAPLCAFSEVFSVRQGWLLGFSSAGKPNK